MRFIRNLPVPVRRCRDRIAIQSEHKRDWSSYYHRRLQKIYQYIIPAGCTVLEIGSGTGDLLATVKPSQGVGIDFSTEMIRIAREKHLQLTFIHGNAQEIPDLDTTFDFIILSDLVNDVWDVQDIFFSIIEIFQSENSNYSQLL